MRRSVVIVGSANMDLLMSVPRLPTRGETMGAARVLRQHGGKGANRAVAAARAGGDVAFVGLVGRDEAGQAIRGDLEAEGIDVSEMGVGESPTGAAFIVVEESTGENLIVVSSGANAELDEQAVESALERLCGPQTVVVADHEISARAVDMAAATTRRLGGLFVLNPAPARSIQPLTLKRCAVVVPNQHEVDRLGFASPSDLLAAGTEAVVVTRGSEGADVYWRARDNLHIDATPVDVVDTTGAGDAFVGVLAVALAENRPLDEAVRWGIAAGALATRSVGARASLPHRPEIEALVYGAGPGVRSARARAFTSQGAVREV